MNRRRFFKTMLGLPVAMAGLVTGRKFGSEQQTNTMFSNRTFIEKTPIRSNTFEDISRPWPSCTIQMTECEIIAPLNWPLTVSESWAIDMYLREVDDDLYFAFG